MTRCERLRILRQATRQAAERRIVTTLRRGVRRKDLQVAIKQAWEGKENGT